MSDDRRKPDWKTWLFRGTMSVMVTIITGLTGVTVFAGKGWAESYFGTIITRIAGIEENTKDLPDMRAKMQIIWQAHLAKAQGSTGD